jgi:DNA polymerase sigma
VTILAEGDELGVLSAVYDELRHNSDYVRLDFRRGKVPIINMHNSKYDLPMDISVNKKDGIRQLREIERMMEGLPEFKYVFMVLKCMLKIRGYSETYHGYVGSYLLFCMVFEYLFHKYDKLTNFTRKNLLSQDLIGFFEFYSGTDWSRLEVLVGKGVVR